MVEAIFNDNVNALFSPRIRILFTIPIAVVRDTRLKATLDSICQVVLLPVVKFYPQDVAHQPDAIPIEASVATLAAVLEKRIEPDLIEPGTLRQIVLLSGGVLRELVRLGKECCRECRLELKLDPANTSQKIDADILTAAQKSLRNQYARPLGNNQFSLLAETYHSC